MTTDIIVPTLGESVTEATVAKWFKAVGDQVEADEPVLELETDKVTLEVNAPAAGTLAEILVPEGEEIAVGGLLGRIGEGAEAPAKPSREPAKEAEKEAKKEAEKAPATTAEKGPATTAEKKTEPAPAEAAEPAKAEAAPAAPAAAAALSPAVRKLVEEHELDPSRIPASGKDGRLTKGDVLAFLEQSPEQPAPQEAAEPAAATPPGGEAAAPAAGEPAQAEAAPPIPTRPAGPREERVRMTRLRKMVAARLKTAQNTAAMLTTFNEVDMTAANALRTRYRDAFEKKHGVRLGIMSIFVKACVVALQEFPAVNAEIDGDDIVYKNYYDIAIAVSSPQGLVVPVLRDADALSFAAVEAKIADYGKRAREGRLTMEELQGGTFTITNGGVFGSLMSTPILNPPQSGILGMHKVQQRPMVMPDGSIEARPMMYLALSYDHRIIDGRDAVSFLVRVKECVEDPQRVLLAA
ncbi:MAG: 2-oxoglutarate dehydrogenase complex dihydrolipoyllysine-residue succinyltransferase [Rhodospirillales bacterium]|nr:MAG: 2-oxoglutarate dehydrogenase complex dihydrolipoyllysine-residue succinyltransferase [Rhodospirillales bacterium]